MEEKLKSFPSRKSFHFFSLFWKENLSHQSSARTVTAQKVKTIFLSTRGFPSLKKKAKEKTEDVGTWVLDILVFHGKEM